MIIITTDETSNGTVFNAKGDLTAVSFSQSGTSFDSGFSSHTTSASPIFGGTPGPLEYRWSSTAGGTYSAGEQAWSTGNQSVTITISGGVGGCTVTVECRQQAYPLDVVSASGPITWSP